MHLLPDAWAAARGARIWAPAVPAAAIASFALAGLAARGGCACGSERRHAGSAGAAAAQAVAMATSSVTVVGNALRLRRFGHTPGQPSPPHSVAATPAAPETAVEGART